jgi:hypothetical protein
MMRRTTLMALMVLAVAAITPVAAGFTLSDSQEPGSVLVFPLFELSPPGAATPTTAFEISITPCNPGNTTDPCDTVEHPEDLDLVAHWVCPAVPFQNQPCAEFDFTLEQTPTGTIIFNPDNIGTICVDPLNPTPGCIQRVPTPNCPSGFLIVWAVDDHGSPIKFDRLIGDVVVREYNALGAQTAETAYNAIPIQAAAALADGAIIPGGATGLNFDGKSYKEVTGKIYGSLHYSTPDLSTERTELVLLTLDVLSDAINNPTRVQAKLYNEAEVPISGSTEFACWERIDITNINPSATTTFGVKGLLVSTSAKKIFFIQGDKTGPVTLLGLVITSELAKTTEYTYPFYNNSVGLPTRYVF